MKCCIIGLKINRKEKAKQLQKGAIEFISVVRQHRENAILMRLNPGEYLIVPSTMKKGDTGKFTFEIAVEDKFVDKYVTETNFMSKLSNTYIEKLGEIKGSSWLNRRVSRD